MRYFTEDAQAVVDKKKVTEPLILVEIEWQTGTAYYSDKDITITFPTGDRDYDGKILNMGELKSTFTEDSSSEMSNVSIELDDTDGSFKDLINQTPIEGTSVIIYQYFQSLESDDIITLFRGKILGGINWSERNRLLSFNIQTYFKDVEIGYALTDDDIDTYSDEHLDKQKVGSPWPVIFGNPKKVKCEQVRRHYQATLKEAIWGNYSQYQQLIQLENYEDFPLNEEIQIDIRPKTPEYQGEIPRYRVRFTGSIDSTTGNFVIKSFNDSFYTDIEVGERVDSDPDYGNERVLWLKNNEIIEGATCYCEPFDAQPRGYQNRCIKQIGKKCIFQKPWYTSRFGTLKALDDGDIIKDCAGSSKVSWGYLYSWWWARETSEGNWAIETITYPYDTYAFEEGDYVTYAGIRNDIYICNLLPYSSLIKLYAEKQNDLGDKYLEELEYDSANPSEYLFTYNDTYSIVGKTVSALEINGGIALTLLEESGYTGDLYADIESPVSSNIPSIIKYLIEVFSDSYLDWASYIQTKDELKDFPANFAIREIISLWTLLQDIAWQARCGISIRSGKFVLTYLSKLPTEEYSISEDNVVDGTLNLTFSSFEELINKMTCKYFENWYDGEKEFVYKLDSSINRYGLRAEERPIYIFNSEALVSYTAGFWGYRYANSWRQVSFESFLNALRLEVFDSAAFAIPIISTNKINGAFRDISYNSTTFQHSLNVELASKTGDCGFDLQPVEEESYWLGDPRYRFDPSIVPNEAEQKRINLIMPFLDTSLGAYYYTNALKAIGAELWNEHYDDWIAERADRIETYGESYLSRAMCICTDMLFPPPAGNGFYKIEQYPERTKCVGESVPERGLEAKYEDVLLYSINPNATLNDIIQVFYACGGNINNNDYTLTSKVYLFRGMQSGDPGYASYQLFKTWITAQLGAGNVEEYTFGSLPAERDWLNEIYEFVRDNL